MSTASNHSVTDEAHRIKNEYRRREQLIDDDRYAPWHPAENLMVFERKRIAAKILKEKNCFPLSGQPCLEIGYGKLGWLSDLLSWGVKESDLHGIELDAERAARAQAALPLADLKIGDATRLPWKDDFFGLIIVSTVFSSILNQEVRDMITDEIYRVLNRDGAVLWYDLAINNPQNSSVRAINKAELKKQFPAFNIALKSVTLAPPIARLIAGKSWTVATMLNAVPLLRTHYLGVLTKK